MQRGPPFPHERQKSASQAMQNHSRSCFSQRGALGAVALLSWTQAPSATQRYSFHEALVQLKPSHPGRCTGAPSRCPGAGPQPALLFFFFFSRDMSNTGSLGQLKAVTTAPEPHQPFNPACPGDPSSGSLSRTGLKSWVPLKPLSNMN